MGLISSLFSGASDRSPTSDFWYTPIGSVAQTGVTVNDGAILRISAAFAAVRNVSQTVAMLPRFVFERELDGRGKRRLDDHGLARIIRYQPNAWQTSFQFFEQMTAVAMMRGKAVAKTLFDPETLAVAGFMPLHPDKVQIRQASDMTLRFIYWRRPGEPPITYRQDEVMHLAGFGIDGVSGINVSDNARDTAGLSIATERFGAKFFSNSAVPRVALEHPGTLKNKAALRESWDHAFSGVDNAFRTAILEEGMKANVLSSTNEDAQFIDTRKFLTREWARWYDMQPHRISDLENASFNNIEMSSLEHAIYTLSPWLKRWEQTLWRDGLTEEDHARNRFVEFVLDGLLRGDSAARAAFYTNAIQNGWLTRNEVRDSENRNPLPGLDEPLQPLNMAPANAPTAPSPQALAVVAAAAERVVDKERRAVTKIGERRAADAEGLAEDVREFYALHVPFVTKVLAVSDARARQYCAGQCDDVITAGPTIVNAWGKAKEMQCVVMALWDNESEGVAA